MKHMITAIGLSLCAMGLVKAAQSPPADAAPPLVRYEAVNPLEPNGDRLSVPRRIAAAVIAQDNPGPKLIVDVGSFTGEFLEAFLEQLPEARGQWTEPVENNLGNAKRRLARFGNRVDYRIGCPGRDLAQGCVPAGVDVLITSWLSIHQNLEGIQRFYREAAAKIPAGGWIVNLDHIGFGGSDWDVRMQAARTGFHAKQEGPPVHHAEFVTPTLEQQLAALKDAGIDDVQVVWRSFNTVLIMGHKH
jgi:hypothetical protein